MKRARRAIVIGGGIAGPAVAMFLKRAAIEPQIFEAYPRAEDAGGGFQIAPNGMRVIEALGLTEAVAAGGAFADGFRFQNHHGRVIGTMRTDRAGKAVTTMRAPFYRALLDAVARAGITVQYGKRLTELTEEGDEVVARFEDGTTARGDFLVGADGVRSRVRALVLPEHAEPRYTGMLGIGGLAGAHAAVPDDGFQRTLNFIVGPRLSFGYAQMGAGAEARWGFWCHLPQDEELSRRALQAIPTDVMRERLQQAFAGWCDPVGPLLASTTTILRTALHEVPSLPAWSRGRAVLIGDAAHAMSPAAGQGASLALEDAMLLGHLLSDASAPVESVFADFERRRRRRVESISAVARDNDERSLKQLGALGCWMRDRTFPLLAPLIARGLEKQYSAALI